MTTASEVRPLTVSDLEGAALLLWLELKPAGDVPGQWVMRQDGSFAATAYGVSVVQVPGDSRVPLEYEISAADGHDVWEYLVSNRDLLAHTIRVPMDLDNYTQFLTEWALLQKDGPIDRNRATYVAIGYMLRFPVKAGAAGYYPADLVDTVLDVVDARLLGAELISR